MQGYSANQQEIQWKRQRNKQIRSPPKKTKQMIAIDKTAKKNIKAMELVVR